MKKTHIKKYEEFTNEEINIKKAITGAALGAGLAFGTPTKAQTIITPTENKEYSLKKFPQENVKNTDLDEVANMDSIVSIKLPSDFEAEKAKVNTSFIMTTGFGLGNSHIPLGGCIFINTPKYGIYVELKGSGSPNAESTYETDDWVHKNTLETEGYSWMTSYGSYTKWTKTDEYYERSFDKHNIFNFGLSAPFKSSFYHLRAYAGIGITRTRSEIFKKVDSFYQEYTYYSLINRRYDDFKSSSVIQGTGIYNYETKLNLSGGVIFEFPVSYTGLSFGIGFDTNPGSFNIMLGVSIGSKNY